MPFKALVLLFILSAAHTATLQAQSKTQWSADGKGIFSMSKMPLSKPMFWRGMSIPSLGL